MSFKFIIITNTDAALAGSCKWNVTLTLCGNRTCWLIWWLCIYLCVCVCLCVREWRCLPVTSRPLTQKRPRNSSGVGGWGKRIGRRLEAVIAVGPSLPALSPFTFSLTHWTNATTPSEGNWDAVRQLKWFDVDKCWILSYTHWFDSHLKNWGCDSSLTLYYWLY